VSCTVFSATDVGYDIDHQNAEIDVIDKCRIELISVNKNSAIKTEQQPFYGPSFSALTLLVGSFYP